MKICHCSLAGTNACDSCGQGIQYCGTYINQEALQREIFEKYEGDEEFEKYLMKLENIPDKEY